MYKTLALLSERRLWEVLASRSAYIYDYSLDKTVPNYDKLESMYPEIKLLRGRSVLCDIYLNNMCQGCPLNCMNIWTNDNYSYYQNWLNAKSVKSKISSARKIIELLDKELNRDFDDLSKLNININNNKLKSQESNKEGIKESSDRGC